MHKLITCIATEDKACETAKSLAKDFGIQAMVDHFARGFGRSATSATKGLGQQTEKVIFSVLVKAEQVDELFDYIYYAAGLDTPHGGIIYVTPVMQSIISPEIDEQAIKQASEQGEDAQEETLVE